MATTYSLSNTGCSANSWDQPLVYKVPDQVSNSGGAEQQAMQLGTQFLAQGPDGSQFYAVYDAERSVPGVRRVLRKV